MKRRSLLVGSGSLLLASALSGCQGQRLPMLPVALLEGSVPPILLSDLQDQLADQARIRVFPIETLSRVYDLLEQGGVPRVSFMQRLFRGRSPVPSQIATLGDTWLTSAIRQNLITPLDVESLSGWERLPEAWRSLVRRDEEGMMAEDGAIWGAPYRWGMLAIVYRKDRFPETPPTDWGDLWRDDLTRQIALPDSARAMIGLTLKHLEHSANASDLDRLSDLDETLSALNQQVRLYSSDAYLQPLVLGDVSLAVGWTTDILPMLKRNPQLTAVIPQSGTLLTADLWVKPKVESTDASDDILRSWIAFFWRQANAVRLSLLSPVASPVIVNRKDGLPDSLRSNPLLLPISSILDASEFLLPLPSATAEIYSEYWQRMRSENS